MTVHIKGIVMSYKYLNEESLVQAHVAEAWVTIRSKTTKPDKRYCIERLNNILLSVL